MYRSSLNRVNSSTTLSLQHYAREVRDDRATFGYVVQQDKGCDNAMVDRVAMKINYLSPIRVAYKTWPSGELDPVVHFNVFSTLTAETAHIIRI